MTVVSALVVVPHNNLIDNDGNPLDFAGYLNTYIVTTYPLALVSTITYTLTSINTTVDINVTIGLTIGQVDSVINDYNNIIFSPIVDVELNWRTNYNDIVLAKAAMVTALGVVTWALAQPYERRAAARWEVGNLNTEILTVYTQAELVPYISSLTDQYMLALKDRFNAFRGYLTLYLSQADIFTAFNVMPTEEHYYYTWGKIGTATGQPDGLLDYIQATGIYTANGLAVSGFVPIVTNPAPVTLATVITGCVNIIQNGIY